MNETIAAVIAGLLLSLSAGVRVTVPLLAVNLLGFYHVVTLPADMSWLAGTPTLIILAVACVAETLIHFIPAAGTFVKGMATPLAFVAGTLLMAVPLSGHNPLYQWALATVVGGGAATLTHLGVTGARALTEPANVGSAGVVGVVWNLGEMLVSGLLALLSGLCVLIGSVLVVIILFALAALALVGMVRMLKHGFQRRALS